MRKSLIVFLPLMLTGCLYNQTGIQGDYESVRVDCQALAESKIDQYSGADDEKDRNAELVTLFSDCMAKEGWQVATPKREIATTGTRMRSDGTMGRVPHEGDEVPHEVMPQPKPITQKAPVQDGAVKTESTSLSPSGSMPPLRQTVNPNAATYQPAPATAPAYGTGPGRSF